MTSATKLIIAAGLSAALAACAATTPEWEAQFGQAARAARAAQTLDPKAGEKRSNADGLDGKAAESAIGRYHESFKNPPQPDEPFTIGVSGTGNGTGSSK